MCGFLTFFTKKLNKQRARNVLDLYNHRGPDEDGIYEENQVFLGHKRLVVVDPEHGKQPYRFGPYVMVYNGELYNTEDIRKDLIASGYVFEGHSDTEVLIKAYAKYKEECVEKLNGIFAFVIYNTKERSFFAARDRVGVKPLYYYYKEGELSFSSEVKGILKYFDLNKIDYNGLQELLGLGPSHTPGSGIYKDVEELRPGYCMKFKNRTMKIWRYWNVTSMDHKDDFNTTTEKVGSLFEDSVRRQLISDVPLCTFLSGGLDSSAITAIAKKYKPDLETYSIDYHDNQKYFKANNFQISDDKDFIELLVKKLDFKHNYCVIDNDELAYKLKDAVLFRDLPGMADIDSSLLWFSEEVKKRYTVALSGECADEIFGGYPWFYGEDHVKEGTFPWLRDLDHRVDLLNDKYQSELKLNDYVQEKYNMTLKETPLNGDETNEERKHKQLTYLNMLWFMTTLLDRKDRMTMGASLEVRVPFADHRLIEYLYNVPWEMKFHSQMEKGLLRKSLEGVVPKEILYRKKSPYPKTHNPEYTNIIKGILSNSLKRNDTILTELFDTKKLQTLIDTNGDAFLRPWFGQLMTGPQLMAYLYQIDFWFREYNLNIVEK
ncbi:asparagine synthase (glutamine-hydrolyzing) [Haloplasma contractile]|uniref:asparagine synthase (glutamine-hydrolyzing) n=1 Tax=Haloplasma contractile SSD-17B TaxID=1033810 RepID=F7PV48_9MOLU|nr:asparagine synthase (glutamine-hydrolyzing) [Haloplasma contractile]ERJ10984.1 asparagine synthase protein [Haloplasma contractile SSD-17B]